MKPLSTCCVVQRWDFDVGITFSESSIFTKIIFFLSPFSLSTDDWCIAKNKAYADIVGIKSVFSHKQWKCMSTFLPLHIEKIIHRVGKSFSYYAAFLHRNEDSEPFVGYAYDECWERQMK